MPPGFAPVLAPAAADPTAAAPAMMFCLRGVCGAQVYRCAGERVSGWAGVWVLNRVSYLWQAVN